MAKAIYQRNQKVWVESVGAWAVVERIVPIWAKGFDEPVKVTYDVGLGREFSAHELKPEQESGEDATVEDGSRWRLLRAHNKWQTDSETRNHPFPGTYPVVVTDPNDWGGWRVPGAEYDRDPQKIEFQARLIVNAPHLLVLARAVMRLVEESHGDAPAELQQIADDVMRLERYLLAIPASAAPGDDQATADAA